MPRMKIGLVLAAATLFLLPQPALAYIGPGAGFALLSSFLVVFTTILIALLSLLIGFDGSRKKLERHWAVEPKIHGRVDDTHGTAA